MTTVSRESPNRRNDGTSVTFTPGVAADLHGAFIGNLRGSVLIGADLSLVAFFNTELSGANLSGANLTRVNFERSIISSVNLLGATGIPENGGAGARSWTNTICPDGTNTDTNGDGTCVGHFLP